MTQSAPLAFEQEGHFRSVGGRVYAPFMANDWHPILNLAEPEPGRWILLDAYENPQAEIELRRTEAGLRYRVTREGKVLGWATSLRVATEHAHQAYVTSLGPGGGANGRR